MAVIVVVPPTKMASKRTLAWTSLASIAAAGLVALLLTQLLAPAEARKETPLKARIAPLEFLYLDKPRALTYLEEIQGGAVSSEEESRSATNTLDAKIKLEEAVEAGASRQEVAQVQRSITPTAASIYMELQTALERGNKKIGRASRRERV